MDASNIEEDEDIIYARINLGGNYFEGATLAYKQGLNQVLSSDTDNLAVRELRYLQSSSDHAVRNNGYAKTALNKWKTNAGGIKVVWKTANGKKHKIMQGYWDEFAKNPSHDGHGDMCTLQGVSNASLFLSGNSYIRMLVQRTGNTATVPFKLQLIPSVLHDIYYQASETRPNGDAITTRHGITFEKSIPTKYHFIKSQLEQQESMLSNVNYRVAVPAEEIVHTFIRETPGQWLGIPMLAPVLLAAYNLDDLLGATINKQQNAQAISMVIEAANNAVSMLPVGEVKKDKTKVKFVSNGSNVIYLNKGETVKTFQGTDIGNNFSGLVENELRRFAATLDLAYHELTGDTAGLNYSSLIGLSIQSRNRLEYLHNFLFIPLRERPIAEAFKKLAIVYNSKCSSAIPYFQLPRWRGIDDLKDMQADLLEVQNGFASYEDKLAERGYSIEDILADRKVIDDLKEFNIILDNSASNPSMGQTTNTQANSNTTST